MERSSQASGSQEGSFAPGLIIRHGDQWSEEHSYILDVLVREHLGLSYEAEVVPGLEWVEIRSAQADHRQVLLVGANLLKRPKEQWLTPAMMPRLPLSWWDPSPLIADWNLGTLPILYPPTRSPSAGGTFKNAMFLPLDVFGGAFFLLARCEELVIKDRDRHGRFCGHDSIAYKAGFILHPVVDEYARLLALALRKCFPGLECRKQEARIRLTHDIDRPYEFYHEPLPRLVIVTAAKAIRSRSPRAAWRMLRRAASAAILGNKSSDPSDNYSVLMAASEALRMPGEFYFKGGATSGRYDDRYSLLSRDVQALFGEIHQRGHFIGLHPSYHTFQSQKILSAELDKLKQALDRAGVGFQSLGGRQHYLRWEHPTTWRCYADAGLDYDATLAFSDHVGFRCGTAKEFPVFDPVQHKRLRLRERPLIVMDVTLTDYMQLSRQEIAQMLEHLWNTVRQVGGTLEVLIHPSNPHAVWMADTIVKLITNSEGAHLAEPNARTVAA